MKTFLKVLPMVFIVFLSTSFHQSKAQTVYIPDANFRAFLQVAYPSCMSGNNLIISCAAGATDPLFLQFKNISNFTGLEYFTSVTEVTMYGNPITTLPALPPSLTYLDIQSCSLTSLPTLPPSLGSLYCSNNSLTSLPTLPNSLTFIDVGANNLTSLPTLPISLIGLSCQTNTLTSLPILPNSLSNLACSHNQLSGLPTLPPSLTSLQCQNNQLINLPSLPSSLTSINCRNNLIAYLPFLPTGLQQLQASGNTATCIPNLPTYPSFTSDIGTTICTINMNITSTSLTNNIICQETTFDVNFTLSGLVQVNNIFYLQLSDINGSFSNPVIIDQFAGTGSGTFHAEVPASVTAGTGYRIRVLASSPATIGATYAPVLSLIPTMVVTTKSITGPTSVCAGQTNLVYSVPNQTGSAFQWSFPVGFTIVSGQGTNSVIVNAGAVITDGNITVHETTACSGTPVEVASSRISLSSYVLNNAYAFCGNNSFYVTLGTTNEIGNGIIGLDFTIAYDANKITPAGSALMGPVATSYGSYLLNTSTSGIVRVSVFLNNVPAGTYFKGNGDIIHIAFTRLAAFNINTIAAISVTSIEESTPVSARTVCNPAPKSVHYLGSYAGRLTYSNSGTTMSHASTYVYGANASCINTTSFVNTPDVNSIFRLDATGGTSRVKIVRDVKGDKDVPTLECSNVQNVINSTDRNLALQISNLSIASPTIYQLLAADVNRDGKVTAGDATLIGSRSVNAYGCEYPQVGNYVWNGTSYAPIPTYSRSVDWLFIDQTTLNNPAYTSGMSRNNVPQPSNCIAISGGSPSVCNPGFNETFIGILLGDVNANWRNATDGANARGTATNSMIINISEATSNGTGFDIPVYYETPELLTGLDFSIDYNGSQVTIDGIHTATIGDWEGVYNNIENEILMVTSYSSTGITSESAVLYLHVNTQDGEKPTVTDLGNITAYVNGENAQVRIQSGNAVFGVNAFPNPFTQNIQLEFTGQKEPVSVKVFDITGKICFIEENINSSSFELGDDFPAGFYIIEASSGESTIQEKVVKQ